MNAIKWGRVAGLALAATGVLVYLLTKYVQDNAGVVYRWSLLGPALCGCGAAMVVAPGSAMTLGDVREDWDRRSELISDASWVHFVFWIGAAVVAGIAAAEVLDLAVWGAS